MITHHGLYVGIGVALPSFFGALALYADTLNPFRDTHRVQQPFRTRLKSGEISLEQLFVPTVRKSAPWKMFAYYKCGWHIVSNMKAGVKASGNTVVEIRHDIHELRFNPDSPYLISGDHFNVLYPRNLGIFYHSTLDANTAHSAKDWENRQRIYLQTVALAIASFSINGECSTTIVPVGPQAVACINIYRYPSDALYGVLYGLASLLGKKGSYEKYFDGSALFSLQTMCAARLLLEKYGVALQQLLDSYAARVYDAKSGLIRTDIAVSSAKDAVLRQSSFYDNVIFWKTLALGYELGLRIPHDIDPVMLKARILKTFWDESSGYFIDDLSMRAQQNQHYSSDWLVVLLTGFLDIEHSEERRYVSKSVAYTITQELDMPFPLRYQETNRARDEVFFVRLAVPSYGGSAIWSFWGAEYIKALLLLHRHESGMGYRERARTHIQTYEKLILKYKGYPEVYSKSGKMLRSPLYQSVRQTGWVVGFEQAQKLYDALE